MRLFDKRNIKDVGGYAVFGAIYFLIGGIVLTRKLSKLSIVLEVREQQNHAGRLHAGDELA